MKIVEPHMYKLNQARFNNRTVKAKHTKHPPTLPFGVWEQHQSWMIPTLILKQTNVDYTLWYPPTLPFGVWDQHQSWMIPTLILKQTNVAYTLWYENFEV